MRRSLLLVPILLAGCVSPEKMTSLNAGAQPPSPALRANIAEQARSYLLDPYSVRDPEISGVVQFAPGNEYVCVRYNAKNAYGAYTGLKSTAVHLKNGRPIDTREDPAACNHPSLRYYPFPEAKQLANL